ncbi:MAG: hypothetical protein ACJ8GN_00820 [Longimicrobiaceae bacterium]
MDVPGAQAPGEMEARLAELTELGCWEWQLRSFDGVSLTLAGGQSMDRGHHAEARFSGVTWISCPTRMMHPRFRLATDLETWVAQAKAEVERGAFVVAIDSQTTASLDAVSIIVAHSVEVKVGWVQY